MILKQNAFQKLAQIMKLKENQEKKMPHPGIEPELWNNKNSVYMERNSSTPIPLGYNCRRYDKCYNLYSTSEPDDVGCVKTTTRNFVKLQKYAFLKQNNFMRIDELPYLSSLFYKLNFVSRRQFFINIGKYPSKMQKVRNDPFLGNKTL